MLQVVVADLRTPDGPDAKLDRWMRALEDRHLANLRFAEVTPALRALSSTYVERRTTLAARAPFDSAGKRAAYALFYGPLHFLTVQAIVPYLPGATDRMAQLADWGCGTGAAGAAWALSLARPPHIAATDVHPWAVAEAAATYRAFGLEADVRQGDILRRRGPSAVDALVLGWMMNEVSDRAREVLLPKLLDLAGRGVRVLVVEPIATRVSPWWPAWRAAFEAAGGRSDEWRFRADLPDLLRRLDKASGMRHDELTARSLWIAQHQKPGTRGQEPGTSGQEPVARGRSQSPGFRSQGASCSVQDSGLVPDPGSRFLVPGSRPLVRFPVPGP